MKNDDLVTLALIGVGLYLYSDVKSFFGAQKWDKQTTVTALTAAGVQLKTTPSGVYLPVTGGTVRVQEGWSPNFAQRALIGLDRVIPGDWLTRAALGI